ncbi:ornithine cyclodeaminase family protein [Falsirhodobacter xinxiangensis]|uniref:ornithine cyclodeaminase family protein n=1 Tax=Falsirhodobacter xinxiangensis TaxID=2530049 RepID=UPI0010AA2186|nr:ornithine cyclodeaminase family protein [Rhodobacter xinxiangensis]
MLVLPEAAIAGLITREDCFDAVENVFVAMAEGAARNFPVIREPLGHADAIYGVKSGFGGALGLKSGGFWPGNAARGLTNHQSTILLFDPDTGQCSAAVGGNLITALRTAAAAAVSIRHLARQDAAVLGIVGAGHQSAFQLRAALDQLPFRKVLAWNRSAKGLDRLAIVAAEAGVPFEAVPLDRLEAEAEVIVTILSSFAPVLRRVRPGTHLACMGTDTRGKQEIAPDILQSASLFTDEIAQAVTIGECQHAANPAIVPLGRVIGRHAGRTRDDEVTLFDGTGVALQDLAVAARVVERARAAGIGTEAAF